MPKSSECPVNKQNHLQLASRVKVKVTQSCPTLYDCIVHGILQARILEWVPFPFSRGSSQPRDRTQVSHVSGRLFTSWATREAQQYWSGQPIPFPADLLGLEIEPGSPALQADYLPTKLLEKPSPITSWQIDWEKLETVIDFLSWLQNHCRWCLQPWN